MTGYYLLDNPNPAGTVEAQVDALTAALRIVVGVQDDSDRTSRYRHGTVA